MSECCTHIHRHWFSNCTAAGSYFHHLYSVNFHCWKRGKDVKRVCAVSTVWMYSCHTLSAMQEAWEPFSTDNGKFTEDFWSCFGEEDYMESCIQILALKLKFIKLQRLTASVQADTNDYRGGSLCLLVMESYLWWKLNLLTSTNKHFLGGIWMVALRAQCSKLGSNKHT